MNIVTLDEIKLHTRIDGDAEDTLLEMYGEAAEDLVLNELNRDLASIYDEYKCLPAPIKSAVLMLVAHMYQHREAISEKQMWEIPYSYTALIKPYMIL